MVQTMCFAYHGTFCTALTDMICRTEECNFFKDPPDVPKGAKVCPVCRKPYTSGRSDKRYCSQDCHDYAAWLRRRGICESGL